MTECPKFSNQNSEHVKSCKKCQQLLAEGQQEAAVLEMVIRNFSKGAEFHATSVITACLRMCLHLVWALEADVEILHEYLDTCVAMQEKDEQERVN